MTTTPTNDSLTIKLRPRVQRVLLDMAVDEGRRTEELVESILTLFVRWRLYRDEQRLKFGRLVDGVFMLLFVVPPTSLMGQHIHQVRRESSTDDDRDARTPQNPAKA